MTMIFAWLRSGIGFFSETYTSGSVTNKGMKFPCNVISRDDRGPVHVLILIDANGDAWEVVVINNSINTISRLSRPPFVVNIYEDSNGTFSCMALFDEIKREYDRGCKVYAIVTSNFYNGVADLTYIDSNSVLFASPIVFNNSGSYDMPNGEVNFEIHSVSRFEVSVSKSESGLTVAEASSSRYYPVPTPPIEVVRKK